MPTFSRDYFKRLSLRIFPCITWLPKYKLQDFRYDIIAGLTIGITLIPQCMSYAQISDVSPQYTLYAGFLGQFIYFAMGSSKDASIGPSSISSLIIAGVNINDPMHYSQNNYGNLMAFFSGIFIMAIGLFRLSFIVNLFSIPVVSGFTTAAGFSICAAQLKSFFGIKKRDDDVPPAQFLKNIANVFERWDQIKINDVAFGLSALCFNLTLQYTPLIVQKCFEMENAKVNQGSRTLTPKQETIMEVVKVICTAKTVIVFTFTTLASYLLLQSDPSFEKSITTVGYIKPGLPELRLPSFEVYNDTVTPPELLKSTSEVFADIAVWMVIIPLMLMMELGAITKSYGRKNGYRVDSTNDLIAVGLGNLLQSFFRAVPCTSAVARSTLNDACRVKTQLASLISATIVITALLALTEVFYFISKAALAGIIISAAYNLIDFKIAVSMYREYWPDLIIFSCTFILCLFWDTAYGILVMIFINMIVYLRPVVRTEMSVTREIHRVVDGPDGEVSNKLTVIRFANGLKYPSADKFIDRVARIMAKCDKHIVLDCHFVNGLDYTGIQAIRAILSIARKQNKHLIFSNLREDIVQTVQSIGIDHWTYVETVDDAIQQYDRRPSLANPKGDFTASITIPGGYAPPSNPPPHYGTFNPAFDASQASLQPNGRDEVIPYTLAAVYNNASSASFERDVTTDQEVVEVIVRRRSSRAAPLSNEQIISNTEEF